MIKLGLFQGCKDSSMHANQSVWYTILTDWKISIILRDAENTFDQIQHPFIIRNTPESGHGARELTAT